MEIKPQNFFIGVVDFFSVLLPGALLTYFLRQIYYDDLFGKDKFFGELNDPAAKWLAFLFITYILGNIVFMIGAISLDYIYHEYLRKQIFQKNYDLTYKTATGIRNNYLNTDKKIAELHSDGWITKDEKEKIMKDEKRDIINTYKWTQHYFLFKNSEALAEIRRAEADSKFFRSMVISFLIMAVLIQTQKVSCCELIILTALFILLALVCMGVYGHLRYKTTNKAYELMITMETLGNFKKTEQEIADFPKEKPAF